MRGGGLASLWHVISTTSLSLVVVLFRLLSSMKTGITARINTAVQASVVDQFTFALSPCLLSLSPPASYRSLPLPLIALSPPASYHGCLPFYPPLSLPASYHSPCFPTLSLPTSLPALISTCLPPLSPPSPPPSRRLHIRNSHTTALGCTPVQNEQEFPWSCLGQYDIKIPQHLRGQRFSCCTDRKAWPALD